MGSSSFNLSLYIFFKYKLMLSRHFGKVLTNRSKLTNDLFIFLLKTKQIFSKQKIEHWGKERKNKRDL